MLSNRSKLTKHENTIKRRKVGAAVSVRHRLNGLSTLSALHSTSSAVRKSKGFTITMSKPIKTTTKSHVINLGNNQDILQQLAKGGTSLLTKHSGEDTDPQSEMTFQDKTKIFFIMLMIPSAVYFFSNSHKFSDSNNNSFNMNHMGMYSPGAIPGHGFRGQGLPGHGFPGQGFPGHGSHGHGFPGQGFPGHGSHGHGFHRQHHDRHRRHYDEADAIREHLEAMSVPHHRNPLFGKELEDYFKQNENLYENQNENQNEKPNEKPNENQNENQNEKPNENTNEKPNEKPNENPNEKLRHE